MHASTLDKTDDEFGVEVAAMHYSDIFRLFTFNAMQYKNFKYLVFAVFQVRPVASIFGCGGRSKDI